MTRLKVKAPDSAEILTNLKNFFSFHTLYFISEQILDNKEHRRHFELFLKVTNEM